MSSFSLNYTVTINSISCQIVVSDSINESRNCGVLLKADGVDKTQFSTIAANSTRSSFMTFDGLIANTTYTVAYSVESELSETTITTSKPPFDKTHWCWSFPHNGDVILYEIDKNEWVLFGNRINEVRVAKNLSSYDFSFVNGEDLYAVEFLQMSTALNEMNCGVASKLLDVNTIKRDGDIYGWYFGNLQIALNNAIDSI